MSSLPSVLQNMNEVVLQPTTEDMVQDAHSLRDLSETVLGMIAVGMVPPAAVEPQWFATPYDRGAKVMKEGGKKEDLWADASHRRSTAEFLAQLGSLRF